MQQTQFGNGDLDRIVLLMNSVGNRYSRNANRILAAKKLNCQTAHVLSLLIDATKVRCRVLADIGGFEATALSRILGTLEKQALIVRQRVKKDNRAVEVRLTQKGRRVARECQAIAGQLQGDMLAGLSGDEMEKLSRFLTSMNLQMARTFASDKVSSSGRLPAPPPKPR